MAVELSKEQSDIVDALVKGIKKKNQQTLGGYAGTGKTTLVRELHGQLPNFAVCAFTGKAANVLRKKGLLEAATIHSLIYTPIPLEKGGVQFDLRPHVDWNGFIVDEASMVNSELYDHLKSFGLPMIFVGDHGQLEPVGNNPNLMANPEYRLEEVHRNAGEIAHFAEWIRLGKKPDEFPTEGKVVFVPAYDKKKMFANVKVMTGVDQIICAFNATRQEINLKVRGYHKYEGKVAVGERVMCLMNNKKLGLFNGMQGVVTNVRKGNVFDFENDLGLFQKIPYYPESWGKEKHEQNVDYDGDVPFDYSYAVTCHKAQGDEWDTVMVIEQVCKHWDHIRWAYTAASRAKNALLWIGAYQPAVAPKNVVQDVADDWF
jgi:exodeoxyribonuclease-5